MNKSIRIKRFYKEVSVAPEHDRFAIKLDGRSAKTPGRQLLIAPTKRLALAIAEEWRSQGEEIDQRAMPLCGMLTASIDGGAGALDGWRDEILKFMGTDLVCYRAEAPSALVRRQAEVWDFYLDFMREMFGAPLVKTAGIVAVGQPDAALSAVRRALEKEKPETLFALQIATAIAGSAVLALAVWKVAASAEDAFEASRVDERFQEEKWGVDEEAKAREARLRQDFLTAARFLSLI